MCFTRVPEAFREIQTFLQGTAGAQLDELLKIPSELTKIFAVENPTGLHKINVIFGLPANFNEDFEAIMKRCLVRRSQKI